VTGVTEQLRALEASNALLVDRFTRPKCGPFAPDGGVVLREQVAHVIGEFEVGVGFLADGATLMSDDNFVRLFGDDTLDRVYLGLVKLKPGTDPERAVTRLREILPDDTRVVTRAALDGLLERHWVESTAVGNIFAMGTVVGFFVGVVVLYQILSADVRTQISLYATLKAMGYGDRRLYGYVLQQAWLFALLGFIPAFAITASCFPLVRDATNLPLFVTAALTFSVFAMSLAMCTLAGVLSLRRISTMDPAELF
jgi:putative ABC transport system permease protein